MSDSNVTPITKRYRPAAPEISEKADRARRNELRHRAEIDRRYDALLAWIKKQKKATPEVRITLAARLAAMKAQACETGRRGIIGPIFMDAGLAKDKTESSKRLKRFITAADDQVSHKGLGANLRDYERLAAAFARHLRMDEKAQVLALFAGLYPGMIGQSTADSGTYDNAAFMLNAACASIACRHDLHRAFSETVSWGLGIDDADHWVHVPAYARFHPDNFPLEIPIQDEDNDFLRRMVAAIPLSHSLHALPIIATSRGVFAEEAPAETLDTPGYWATHSMHGTEDAWIPITHVVHLGYVPDHACDALPVLLECYQVTPILGEDRPFALKSISNGWYTFQSRLADSNIETNAFRLDANRLHARDLAGLAQALEAAITLDGGTRLWRLSSASLSTLFAVRDQLRGNHQFNAADAVIWGDDWDTLVDEREDIASHAPALKKAAAIERNLVYAPIDQRLDTLLEQQVLRFKKKLSDFRRAQADAFDAAAESVLARWTVSDPGKGEPGDQTQ